MRIKEELNTMIQGSDPWLEWRRQGIGASETPCLMGESDFDTPYTLYLKKKGLAVEKSSNFAMQRGTDSEPKIRALYELENDLDMPATLKVHPEYDFIRASLDAWNEDEQRGAEFKCLGLDNHVAAMNGMVPKKYYGQVQHQMFVTGTLTWDYVSLHPDFNSIAVVKVARDEEYLSRMLPVLKAFWLCVEKSMPPSLTDQDVLEMNDEESVQVFMKWKSAKLKQMQIEELFDQIKEQTALIDQDIKESRELIARIMKHPKVECAGVKVITKKTGLDIRMKDEK